MLSVGSDLHLLPQFIVTGLGNGAIYALVALGFYIIFSGTGIINFAQGQFVMAGSLFMWLFRTDAGLPPILALPAVALCCAGLGILFERVIVNPTKGRPVLVPIFLTIAAAILIQTIFGMAFGKDALPVRPFTSGAPLTILDAVVRLQTLWILGGTLVALPIVYLIFNYTAAGLSLRAAAINPLGAAVVGIDLGRVALYAFAFGAAISGIGGALFAPITTAKYDIGFGFTLRGFASAVAGGLDSAVAVVLGGFSLGLFEALCAGYISSNFRDAMVYAVIIVALIARPQGLFGKAALSRV